jgi:hypothetical protein
VEDRQDGGELPAIDLKVRRKRPVGGSHLQQFRYSARFRGPAVN